MSSAYIYNAPRYCEFEIKNKLTGVTEHKVQVEVRKERIIIDNDLVVKAAQVEDLRSVLYDALKLINLDIETMAEETTDED